MRYLYSFIQKVIEKMGENTVGLRIYMFHQINDDKTEWKDKGISITQTGFKMFIEGLQAKGCHFLTLADLSPDKAEPRNVIITFDDIFQDAVKNAIPFLVEKNIPFCVFITENYIDSENFLTSESIQKLIDEPLCTIGFHTKNHKLMRFLTRKEVGEEMECNDFEKLVGRNISFFAFPYGSLYACTIKSILVAKRKYTLVFSTVSIPCSKRQLQKVPFFLPRINICEGNYRRKLKEIRF